LDLCDAAGISTKDNNMAKRKKTGGRQAGTPNRVTKILMKVAGKYTRQAVTTLAAIMNDEDQPGAARVMAARELLDRAHGKPTQPHSGEDGGPIQTQTTVVHRYESAVSSTGREPWVGRNHEPDHSVREPLQ
jgi:hypothetical protein